MDIFKSPKSIGMHVIAKRRTGDTVKGTIIDFKHNKPIVAFDKGEIGEWDDPTDEFDPNDLRADYDANGMKEIMKKWRQSTGTSAGPEGPMKHVKSFLTGRSRRRKSKKVRKTRKHPKRI